MLGARAAFAGHPPWHPMLEVLSCPSLPLSWDLGSEEVTWVRQAGPGAVSVQFAGPPAAAPIPGSDPFPCVRARGAIPWSG